MITKKHLLLLVILPILLLSLAAINVPVQSAFPGPYVKVFTKKPVIPYVNIGKTVNIRIDIEIVGISDNSANGVVGWGLYVQVDPNVLELKGTKGGQPFYFLYNFTDHYYPASSVGLLGNLNPASGIADLVNQISPTPPGGAGDGTSYDSHPRLVVVTCNALSNTTGSYINLYRVEYMTPDGLWHPVDITVDGYYGTTADTSFQSEATGTYSPTDNPEGTMWDELSPTPGNTWTMDAWIDNGDGTLSGSDQIAMQDPVSGWYYPFHVDVVTTTIHWTFKTTGTGAAEPDESDPERIREIMKDPIDTYWHTVYPAVNFSTQFKIIDWDDNTGESPEPNGKFDPSDQFLILYADGTTVWAHLDSVTTDIIISQKGPPSPDPIPEFPIGVALMIAVAPAIPILYLWRRRKKVVAK